MELAAAGVGLPKLRRQPPCHSSQERAPHNTEVLLEFLLHISGRSPQAMALAQKLVLGLFAHTPHSIVKLCAGQQRALRAHYPRAASPRAAPVL
eukprot:1228610-Prymnesium_polylepis.1